MGHVHEFLVQIAGRTPISLVHDAFIVDGPEDIDRVALTDYVKEKTGFRIDFKYTVLGPTEEDKALYEKHLPFVTHDDEDKEIDHMDDYLDMSDFKMATIMFKKYQEKFVTVTVQNRWRWFEFSGHRWVDCPNGATLISHMNDFLHARVSIYINQLYKQIDMVERKKRKKDSDLLEKLRGHLRILNKSAKSIHNIGTKERILKECAILFHDCDGFLDKLDSKPNLLGFNNGVFDLDKNEFRAGLPEDYLTMSTGYDYTPVAEPEIRNEILGFYESIAENQEGMDYLLATQAYALHGTKHLEEFWNWTGVGSNGKSVNAGLLDMTLGQYYYEADIGILTQKKTDASKCSPELAKLYGKRMVVMSEPEITDCLQSNLVKKLTGNDKIQARGLYQDVREFRPQFSITILCNGVPNLSSYDQAITRRIRVVPFKKHFVDDPNPSNPFEKKVDRGMKRRFENDVRYHQQLMLLLIERFQQDVRGKNKIMPPQSVLETTTEYLSEQDIVRAFIHEFFEVTNDPKHHVQSSQLYQQFKCSTQGRTSALPSNKFKDAVLNVGGIQFKSTKKCNVFTNLKEKPHDHDELDGF